MFQTAFAASTYTTTSLLGTTLGIFLGLAFVGFTFASIVLCYHWMKYSMGDPFVPFMQILYFLGGLILLGLALFLIL